jgi:hypothetical protein
MTPLPHKRRESVILLLVLLLAAFLRLYNISWDRGYLFHPDERQVLVVADALSVPWPPDLGILLTPESPLNPGFFAYGSLPIYLLKLISSLAGRFVPDLGTLESSYKVGRVLSALFDLGTVYLVYCLGRRLYDATTGLLGAAFVALTVLHVQLSHFYAVDTPLTFLVVLVILLAVRLLQKGPDLYRALGLGVAMGAALATKISAAPLAISVVLAWYLAVRAARSANLPTVPADPRLGIAPVGAEEEAEATPPVSWLRALWGILLTGQIALATFILFQPYAAIDVVRFVSDVVQEGYMVRGVADVPYTRQYIGTLPYVYSLWQMMLWSTGVPLGLAGLAGALAASGAWISALARKDWLRAGLVLVPSAWVLIYFGLVGSFHAKFLRYMLPVTPFLALWAAWGVLAMLRSAWRPRWMQPLGGALLALVLVPTALYAAAYLNVYRNDHTWVQATDWLCRNLSPGSHIMIEHWDDPLPLLQGTGELRCFRRHIADVFPAYSPDTQEKLDTLLDYLERNDFIILSSNRLYNAIPRLPWRYPVTSRYYELLMGEELGFELVYYAAVYPELMGWRLVDDTFRDPLLPRPRLLVQGESVYQSINLGRADESYSVYDHPMPLVFAKRQALTRAELSALFADVADALPAR